MESDLLSQREIRRYDRQIMIPDLGLKGQEALKKAKVLVAGAGGLGCPVLQYLTAAGVGRIAIAEFDMVGESNLQRQVLYGTSDVGKLKSIIAKSRLEHLNPNVEFEILNIRLEKNNAISAISNYDIIVDATDNLESRYVINDSCVSLNKPMVHGSIYKFEGLISVFNYQGGPTYRCYNPSGPEGNFRNPVPSEVGLLGVLPGITGTYMANEVIKIITGIGEVLAGKILLVNILNNTFRTFTVNNIPENHKIRNLNI